MAIIRQNSISGISSITAQNNAVEFFDSSGVKLFISGTDGIQVATGATISGTTNTITALTNGVERLRITSAGKIGINEISPSAMLEVKGTVTAGDGNNEDLQRWNIASDNVKAEVKYIDAAADRGMLFGTTTDHVLAFQTNNSERLRITSAGKIQVTGTRAGSLQASDNDSLELYTSSASDSINRGSGITFYNHDGSGYEMGGTIQVAKENGTADNTSSYMRFATRTNGSDAAEQVRITSDGDFRFNSGYGSAATAYGCRAWVNFNGTGTVSIRASGNVSSITDNGTGDYTINFATAMIDTDYICTGTSGLSNTANQSICPNFDVAAPTTSAMRIQTTNSANVQDRPYNHVAVFR